MTYTTMERTAHVARRLGLGTASAAATPEEAMAAAFDTSADLAEIPAIKPPVDEDEATDYQVVVPGLLWWVERMAAAERPLEERMSWFWHDHFAIHARKVRFPYLAWQNHLTIRSHALGNFADLLTAMSTDPAMLIYLDTVRSTAKNPNENFARELMELHTLGTGTYTQTDVTEAARAMTGWVVKLPFARRTGYSLFDDAPDWESLFVPRRWDGGTKTVLGESGNFGMADMVDLLLDHPATAGFVTAKLYRELVGLEPPSTEVDRLAAQFQHDYDIRALATAIVESPAFLSDAAIRAKVRTPLEKLTATLGAFGGAVDIRSIQLLDITGFVPFTAPNPAGYPEGAVLTGPHRTVHTLDLALLVPDPPPELSVPEVFAALGVRDVSSASADVVESAPSAAHRIALAIGSPEFALI